MLKWSMLKVATLAATLSATSFLIGPCNPLPLLNNVLPLHRVPELVIIANLFD
jgi:hypothetical protein